MNKLTKLIELLNYKNIDGFFTSNPSTVQYLSKAIANRYPPRTLYFFSTKEKGYVIAPKLEFEQTVKEVKNCEVLELSMGKTIESILSEYFKPDSKIGIEATYISLSLAKKLKKKGIKLIDLSKEISEIIAIKDSEEIEKIKKAVKITEEVLSVVRSLIKEGNYTEKEIAKECMSLLLKKGCEWFSFEPIIASGKNGAYPHAVTTDSYIENNTFTIVDIGGKFEGYCADLTRTYSKGEIDSIKEKHYEIVKNALEEAIAEVKEGIVAKQVDLKAREILKKNGLDQYFIHGLGHGIGIDVHEYPSINSLSEAILKENMIITIEPGIYLKDNYGIRIEEDVLVKKDKAEILSSKNIEF